MLTRLFIRHFALIDEAELQFSSGFTVFTGETGAGKSMLIDALSLALGARGGIGFIHKEADQATIEATFELPAGHRLGEALAETGVDFEDDELVLRRQLLKDGKTRCFLNGCRISQAQLQAIGERLVDIHGQHDHQLLLRATSHGMLLDRFGGHLNLVEQVQGTYRQWHTAVTELQRLQEKSATREHELALLSSYVNELEAFRPQAGEEAELDEARRELMGRERTVGALQEALELFSESAPSAKWGRVEKALAALVGTAGDNLSGLLEQVSEAAALSADVEAALEQYASAAEPDPAQLEQVDERLHQLRQLARKHKVAPDDLLAKLEELQAELEQLENAETSMTDLEALVVKERAAFEKACQALTAARQKVAAVLAGKVEAVLAQLKMPTVRFAAQLQDLPNADWNRHGAEQVAFYVQTNPGTPLAPLVKAASGGEVSRLMLALKVVFFAALPSQTLIFDEVDTGVGGAVADAVGQCLRELARQHQVFAITHLPQVAAKGAAHVRISKQAGVDQTRTSVEALASAERLDEIARMLAGAEVTSAAREAAASLLKG